MKRLDVAVFESGLTDSRTSAQNLITKGAVSVNGVIVTKPSEKVIECDRLELVGELPKYVSRGGYKLETAVNGFGIKLNGCICLDIGASTGGFTDCMLQNGAELVYAVDVGTNQLCGKLKHNPRVISLEQTDVRKADINVTADFIAVDVSFISLKLVLPVLNGFLKRGGYVCALIKPQFEIGKKHIKNGILKDKKKKEEIVADIESFVKSLGYEHIGTIVSNIKGADGNEEFLVLFRDRRRPSEESVVLV